MDEAIALIGELLPCQYRKAYDESCIEHLVIRQQWCRKCKFYMQPRFAWLVEALTARGRVKARTLKEATE